MMSSSKGLPLCHSSQNQIPRHTQGGSGCALRDTEDLIGKMVEIIFFLLHLSWVRTFVHNQDIQQNAFAICSIVLKRRKFQ